jgi:hypothetical protein
MRQDELEFMKAIFTLLVSPDLLKDLRMAMARRKKKKPTVPAGKRNTISGRETRVSQQLAGKRKPKSCHAKANIWSQTTGAQYLGLRPRLCPRIHQSRRGT